MHRIVLLLSATVIAFAETAGPGPGAPAAPATGGGQPGAADPTGGLLSMLPMIIAMILIFYFLAIRPQRKEEKRRKELIEATKPGDEVVTIGGLIGVVEKVGEAQIEVRLGGEKGLVVPFLKSAVATNKSAEKVAEVKK